MNNVEVCINALCGCCFHVLLQWSPDKTGKDIAYVLSYCLWEACDHGQRNRLQENSTASQMRRVVPELMTDPYQSFFTNTEQSVSNIMSLNDPICLKNRIPCSDAARMICTVNLSEPEEWNDVNWLQIWLEVLVFLYPKLVWGWILLIFYSLWK